MSMTMDDAMSRARLEFAKFQLLFEETAAENPTLSYDQVNDLVEYEHPLFDDEGDQDKYDTAAMLVAFETVMSVL